MVLYRFGSTRPGVQVLFTWDNEEGIYLVALQPYLGIVALEQMQLEIQL